MKEPDSGPPSKGKGTNGRGRVESVYRRRRASNKGRRLCRTDVTSSEVSDPRNERRSKTGNRRLERLIDRLCKDNLLVRRMLEDTDLDAGITEKIRESEQVISKIHREYAKLERNNESAQEECLRLTGLLESRDAECQRLTTRCKTLEDALQEAEEAKADLQVSNGSLEEENSRCIQDVALLKNLVYRLNRELERYQDKLWQRATQPGDTETTKAKQEETMAKSWGGVEFHALAPLLNAYQENLQEKQDLLTDYEQQLARFGGRCKDVILENERLHRELEDLESKETLQCNRYRTELDDLLEKAESLRKENASLLKDSLSRKRADQETRLTHERQVESILERNEALQRTQVKITAELNDLRGRHEVLSQEYQKLRDKEEKTIPLTVHTAALEECKTLLDQLKRRYEAEQGKLCERVKKAEEDRPESENRLAVVTAERNHLKALTKTLEKNLRRIQRRTEHTQNMLQRVELSRDAMKKQLSRTTGYCEELFFEYERAITEREKLAGLLRETEMENASIDRLGKDLVDRMTGLKEQLKVVQRRANLEMASAEKRIKQQEAKVGRMKREYRLKVRRLNKLMKQRENRTTTMEEEYVDEKNKNKKKNSKADEAGGV